MQLCVKWNFGNLKSENYSEEALLKELVMGYGSMLSLICGQESKLSY